MSHGTGMYTARSSISKPIYSVCADMNIWNFLRLSNLERLSLIFSVFTGKDATNDIRDLLVFEQLARLPLPTNLRYLDLRYVENSKTPMTRQVEKFESVAAQFKALLPGLRRVYMELTNFRNPETIICRFSWGIRSSRYCSRSQYQYYRGPLSSPRQKHHGVQYVQMTAAEQVFHD